MTEHIFELATEARRLEAEGKRVAAIELMAAWAKYCLSVFEDAQQMDDGPLKELFHALALVKE